MKRPFLYLLYCIREVAREGLPDWGGMYKNYTCTKKYFLAEASHCHSTLYRGTDRGKLCDLGQCLECRTYLVTHCERALFMSSLPVFLCHLQPGRDFLL